MLNRTLFWQVAVSFCVYTVWYDASFLKWNSKILMKWLSQPVSSYVQVYVVSVVRRRGRK